MYTYFCASTRLIRWKYEILFVQFFEMSFPCNADSN